MAKAPDASHSMFAPYTWRHSISPSTLGTNNSYPSHCIFCKGWGLKLYYTYPAQSLTQVPAWQLLMLGIFTLCSSYTPIKTGGRLHGHLSRHHKLRWSPQHSLQSLLVCLLSFYLSIGLSVFLFLSLFTCLDWRVLFWTLGFYPLILLLLYRKI